MHHHPPLFPPYSIIILTKQIMDEQVVITVSAPEQRSEIAGVNKYFVYTIRGKDAKGDIDITRRYSDFFLLRQILVKRWPGFYVPSLPEKKTIGSDDKLFVENRRRGLEYFLTTLAENSRLWQAQEVDIFLRNSSGDSEKLLAPLMKEPFEKLLQRYRSQLGELQGQEKEAGGRVAEFNSYLRGSKPILEKLGEMTQRMHELARRALEKRLVLLEFLLPDYEKHCLLENDQKRKADSLLFLCASTNGIADALTKYKLLNEYPPVLLISQEIRRERREIEAFEDALKGREELEAERQKAAARVKDLEIEGVKINAGKESFFNKLKKVSKEEQLAVNQKQLDRARAEEQDYATLTRIVTNLISAREIDRFKQKRQKAYYRLLQLYAREEKALAEGENDLWTQVGRHDAIALDEQNILLKKEEPKEDTKEHSEEPSKELTHEETQEEFKKELEIKEEDI